MYLKRSQIELSSVALATKNIIKSFADQKKEKKRNCLNELCSRPKVREKKCKPPILFYIFRCQGSHKIENLLFNEDILFFIILWTVTLLADLVRKNSFTCGQATSLLYQFCMIQIFNKCII